jgi:hypothetical protein
MISGQTLRACPEALQIRACLCHESVKNHFDEGLRGVYPDKGSMIG